MKHGFVVGTERFPRPHHVLQATSQRVRTYPPQGAAKAAGGYGFGHCETVPCTTSGRPDTGKDNSARWGSPGESGCLAVSGASGPSKPPPHTVPGSQWYIASVLGQRKGSRLCKGAYPELWTTYSVILTSRHCSCPHAARAIRQ